MEPTNTNIPANPIPAPVAPVVPSSQIPVMPTQPVQSIPPVQAMPNQSITPEKHGMGKVIALILVLAILLVGAMYFAKTEQSSPDESASQTAEATNEPSDSAASIEADLNSTNVDSVDATLDESEYNAS